MHANEIDSLDLGQYWEGEEREKVQVVLIIVCEE